MPIRDRAPSFRMIHCVQWNCVLRIAIAILGLGQVAEAMPQESSGQPPAEAKSSVDSSVDSTVAEPATAPATPTKNDASEPASEVVSSAAMSAERISSDLKHLSSDEMQGRGVETAGIQKAADFIAKRWKELGFQTDLFDGSPFQTFTVSGPKVAKEGDGNRLELKSPEEDALTLRLGIDFNPLSLGSNGAFEGPIAFAGYGITAKEKGLSYDDYQGLDVQGKIVIVLRKEPQQNLESSPFAGTAPSNHAYFQTKVAVAARHGASALIFLNDSATIDSVAEEALIRVDGAGQLFQKPTIPTLFVKRKAIEAWLEKRLGKSIRQIEAEIDSELKPQSSVLEGSRAKGSALVEESKLEVKNVLAVLPGEGELANETVVVGAHYDHVGMGGGLSLSPGIYEVHNGADDNGSGTVAILELGRSLKESLQGPRRQILFISFTAEEMGLLGSQYYVEHPRYPLEQTVAMINLDMVGRLTDSSLTVYGLGTATNFSEMIDRHNERYQFHIDRHNEGMGPSDHQSFYEKNIPVFHFFTGLHPEYHRPSDDFDKINVTGIVSITDMVRDVIVQIATDPTRPEFRDVQGRANPLIAPRAKLGISLASGTEQAIVAGVTKGGPAAEGGLLANDIILKMGTTKISDAASVIECLEKRKPGDQVEFEIQRNDEIIKLLIELGR